MRGSYNYKKLEKLKANLPSGIDFSIDYRKGNDDVFSVKKGKVCDFVLAVVDTIADKMFYEAGNYLEPVTTNGFTKLISNDCLYLVDSLFHAVESVWYDDKSCAYYEVFLNEDKLTKKGREIWLSLKKSECYFELDVGSGEYGGGAISATLG
jgi:hypothetical protein